jgi:copper homeostasis protein (lipoprotein)
MRRWSAGLALLALVVCAASGEAVVTAEGVVTGTASYGQPITMPPGAVFEATLEDVSRTDVAADVITVLRVEDAGSPPYHFALAFDPAKIVPSRRYAVRARVTLAGRLLFTSDQAHPVITNGQPTTVEIPLKRVAGAAGRAAGGKPGDLYATLPATFSGTLPCADCEGVAVHLDILPDTSFMLRTRHLGHPDDRSVDDIGTWALSSDGITLVLKGSQEAPLFLAIEDADTLRMLDVSGRAFEARLDYDLKRSGSHSPIEPVLPLRGMFSYLADAASFGECLTGRRLPVAMEGGYIDLERAYLAARAGPGVPLMALVDGRIAMRDPMEGPAAVPTLVVDRFVSVLPGEQCPPRFQSATLEGTRWKLTWLEDEAIRPIEGQPEPGLVLHGDDKRLAGTDGCNRLLAGYMLEADRIRFSAVASTMISCPKGAEVARRFAAALAAATRWRVLGRQLELYDRQDRLLARFEAGTDP